MAIYATSILIQLTTIAGTVDAIPEKVAELIWLSQILSIKHYELSIEKSLSPVVLAKNEKMRSER